MRETLQEISEQQYLNNMKTISTLLFIICTICSNAQSERSLDETKSYIVKMINEYGWKENSNKNRLHAEFNDNLMKISIENSFFGSESIYNFANVYRYKGPIKEPGDIGHIIIWVDRLSDKSINKWSKDDLEMDIHNYEVAEQLMKAFSHLNKLLLEQKPEIEKF